MGHQPSTPQCMKPYMDRNVGRQLRYIKMNVGHVDHHTTPNTGFSLYLQIYSSALYTYFITYLITVFYILYLKLFLCCLRSCLPSQVSLLPLGISSSGLKGQILKPGRPGGDKPLAMLTIDLNHHTNSDKFLKTSKNHIDNTLFSKNLSESIQYI